MQGVLVMIPCGGGSCPTAVATAAHPGLGASEL